MGGSPAAGSNQGKGAQSLRTLIFAAWEPELVRARALAVGNSEIVFAALGVGAVEAAHATARALDAHRPDVALLIGTCGVFDRGRSRGADRSFEVGDVVVGAGARLVDVSLLDGTSEIPAPMPIVESASLREALLAESPERRCVQIANTLGITVGDALADRIANALDCEVEHLEAFGFLRACAAAKTRSGILLGVANRVGSGGRAEWLANHERASANAGEAAIAALPTIVRTSTTAQKPG